MKKRIVYILLVFFSLNIYAKDIDLSFLKGTWAPENELPSNVQIQLKYDQFYPNDSSFDFFLFNDTYPYLGMLKLSGLSYGYLIKSYSIKDESLICECYLGHFSDNDIEVYPEKYNVTITIIDDSWILIDGLENESILKKSNRLYRVKEGRKEPVHRAVVNDSFVRVRTAPNLQSQTMYLLPKDLKVQVVDQSDTVTEIDGEKWCWYKIRSIYTFDGWIYGKYLDINQHNLIEEKVIKIENWGFRKGDLYTYINDCKFSYYSDFDLSTEELQDFLQKIDCTGDIIKNLNTVTTKYEFSDLKITGKLSSKSNKEMFRDIYFGFSQSNDIIKSSDTFGDKFNKTIVVKSNKHGYCYGVSIGMQKSEVEAIFGTPDEQNENSITYKAENSGLFTFEFCFDENNILVSYSCSYKRP